MIVMDFTMEKMSSRHKYGTFVLIFAVIAFLLSIFSTGATWATVDDESITIIEDEGFFDNITFELDLSGDLQLTEMDSEIEVRVFIDGFDEPVEDQTFRESESYEKLAEKSSGDMSTTFEDMDTAGTVAQWMLWLGIIAMLITAIFAFCSLAQITNSRFTTYSGSVATFFLFFAPIIWYILLPSDGTYTSLEIVEAFFFFDESQFATNFDPSPSTGLFLSLLSALSSIAMMVMVYRHNISEIVNEKPKWMDSLFNLKLNDEEKVAQPINFTEKKEQAGLLIQKSVNVYKSSRTMQALTVLIVLTLVSIPLYSILFEEEEEANAYQRELQYYVDGDSGRIIWIEGTEVINDGETLSFSFTEEDFPDEAKNSNIVAIEFYIYITDNNDEDNEQTSGLGCVANPGQDAPDSVEYRFNTPGGSDSSQSQSNVYTSIELLELPEQGFGPYTGYTIEEIEDLFDSSDEVVGDYEFMYTANAEAGDSTFECDRSDSSVQIQYYVDLIYFDTTVFESTEFQE